MADLNYQSLLQPDSEDIQSLNRNRALSQMLLQQGQQQPQGQMISGHYVAPSITQYLNPLFSAYAGSKGLENADTQQQQLATALRGKQQEVVQQYANAQTPQEKFQIANSPYAPTWMQQSAGEMAKPQKLGEGETISQLNLGTGKYEPLAQGGEKLTNEVKTATATLGLPNDPNKWTPQDRVAIQSQIERMKRAGASNVSVRTGNSLAEQIGPMMTNSANQTIGAMKVNDAADQILNSLSKGNVIAGPGANIRIPMAQVASMIGAGGKDDAEKLANTRTMVQNLAKLTLAGRQQMHGEGAISNSESNIAEKAMSGSENLTPGEIVQLANAAKRSANYQVQSHQQKLKVMESNPETRGLAPYYQVNGMTPVAPTNNNVVDYNSLK